jgi:hypothetical protein
MLSKDRMTRRYDRWTPNALKPETVNVRSRDSSSLVVDAVWKPTGYTGRDKIEGRRELSGTVGFKVEGGRVRVEYLLSYGCARKLVESGFALELPAEFRRFDWVGLGPYECYPLVSMLSEFGIWAYDRDDLRFSGNRRDVHLALATAADGRTAAFAPCGPGDVVFERRGEKTLIGHNAVTAGKACKFNDPRLMAEKAAGETLEGAFYFVPPVKELKTDFLSVFGERDPLKPFAPFFKSYDQ